MSDEPKVMTAADLAREESEEEARFSTKWDAELMLPICAAMAEAGAIDAEIAVALEVGLRTFTRWKSKYPEIPRVLKVGKQGPDDSVKRSLYSRAKGYEYIDHKVFYNQKTGEVVKVPVTVHVPPDTVAGIFWTKNRLPDEFRDVKGVEHSGVVRQVHQLEDLSDDEIRRRIEANERAIAGTKRTPAGAPTPEPGKDEPPSVH